MDMKVESVQIVCHPSSTDCASTITNVLLQAASATH